jgi:hypothetical protein
MDAREAFKFGFISRCLEAGLTSPGEIRQAIKQASEKVAFNIDLASMAAGGVTGAGNLAGEAAGWLIPAAIAGPPIVGYLGGNALAAATNTEELDPAEAKRQELIDEYKRQGDRIKRQSLVNKYRQTRQQSGRVFL